MHFATSTSTSTSTDNADDTNCFCGTFASVQSCDAAEYSLVADFAWGWAEHLGCFADNEQIPAMSFEVSVSPLTSEWCSLECAKQTYPYAAVNNALEKCFCSNDLVETQAYGRSDGCDGSSLSNDVYFHPFTGSFILYI